MKSLLIFLPVFCSWSIADSNIPIQLNVTNLETPKGNLIVSVFIDQESFAKEEPFLRKVFVKKDYLKDDVFTCSFGLEPGTYGIALLDDENADGEMNYNFIGMPKEGYGFSYFYHTSLSRPVFSDFSFALSQETHTMNIKLRYF